MATIPEALTIAVDHHRAGRLEMAEQVYRQILDVEPNQPDAWHMLGVVMPNSGDARPERSASGGPWCSIRNGPTRRTISAISCGSRGSWMKRSPVTAGPWKAKPAHAEACSNLGSVLSAQGEVRRGDGLVRPGTGG